MVTSLNFLQSYAQDLGLETQDQDTVDLSNSLNSYTAKEGLFGCEILFRADNINTSLWWSKIKSMSNHKVLASIGVNLLRILSKSASLEKSWSLQNIIHTNMRK